MKFDSIGVTLSNLGLEASAITELSTIAKDLPTVNIAAVVNGLDETETATLVSHLLQEIAPGLGVIFDHENLVSELGFPIYQPRKDQVDVATASESVAGGNATHYDSAN